MLPHSSTHDVFISHSRQDTEAASAIKQHLHAAGLTCWTAPDDINPGASWPSAIMRALSVCRVMVLVWSRHSLASKEVAKELTLAMRNGLTVIPFRIEDVQPTSEWDYHLANTHWMDAFPGQLQAYAEKLAARIRAVLHEGGAPSLPAIHDANRASASSPKLTAAAGIFKKSCSKLIAHRWLLGISALAALGITFYTMPASQPIHLPTRDLPILPVPGRTSSDFSAAEGEWRILEMVSDKLGGYWIKWAFTLGGADGSLVLQGRKLHVNDEPADSREKKALFTATLVYNSNTDLFTGRAEERNADGEVMLFDVELRFDNSCATLAGETYQGGKRISQWSGTKQPDH